MIYSLDIWDLIYNHIKMKIQNVELITRNINSQIRKEISE